MPLPAADAEISEPDPEINKEAHKHEDLIVEAKGAVVNDLVEVSPDPRAVRGLLCKSVYSVKELLEALHMAGFVDGEVFDGGLGFMNDMQHCLMKLEAT